MYQLYYQPKGAWFGDCMPFGKGDEYYLFHQRDTRNPEPFGEPFGWALTTTKDFVHYEDHGEVVPRGGDDAQDQFVFAGSVFEGEGCYHIFYTGHNRDFPAAGKPAEVLMHATSHDLIHWEKTNDSLTFTPQPGYDQDDWRDPWVIKDTEHNQYLLILGARLQGEKTRQSGRTVQFTSSNLKDWKFQGDFWAPDLYTMHEMPDLFKMGDWWYHIVTEYSDRHKMTYRMSRSLNGPWIAPYDDAFDGRAYYAGRTFELNGQRILFGWVATRKHDDDTENFEWAGTFMPHEVFQRADGSLGCRPPESLWGAFEDWQNVDDFRLDGETSTIKGPCIPDCGNTFAFECDIVLQDGLRTFGLRVRDNVETEDSYRYLFVVPENRFLFDRIPNEHGDFFRNIGLERPIRLEPDKRYHIRLIVDDTIATLWVDGVALNARMYAKPGDCLRIFASEGSLLVNNARISRTVNC